MNYEERRDAAYKISQTTTHAKAIELIVLTKLAPDTDEAEQLIRDGEKNAERIGTTYFGIDPARVPDERLPRYDPVLQEAEDDLTKRHGRRAAQEMIDEEDSRISGKGR